MHSGSLGSAQAHAESERTIDDVTLLTTAVPTTLYWLGHPFLLHSRQHGRRGRSILGMWRISNSVFLPNIRSR